MNVHFGTTTTGNVEKIVFQNSVITAQICGVTESVVKNLFILWGTLSCGFHIDSDKFGKLCKATEDTYFDPVNGVRWYHLTSTLHKVFKRSKVILDHCILPIEMTSEEASEANNKNLRKFRMNHARKMHARKNTWKNVMYNVFFRLFLTLVIL